MFAKPATAAATRCTSTQLSKLPGLEFRMVKMSNMRVARRATNIRIQWFHALSRRPSRSYDLRKAPPGLSAVLEHHRELTRSSSITWRTKVSLRRSRAPARGRRPVMRSAGWILSDGRYNTCAQKDAKGSSQLSGERLWSAHGGCVKFSNMTDSSSRFEASVCRTRHTFMQIWPITGDSLVTELVQTWRRPPVPLCYLSRRASHCA